MQLLHILDKETKEFAYYIGFFDKNDVNDFLVTCRKIDTLLESARGNSDACRYGNLADKIISRWDAGLTGPNGELIIKLEPQELCSLFSIFSTFTKADMILYESLYGLIDI